MKRQRFGRGQNGAGIGQQTIGFAMGVLFGGAIKMARIMLEAMHQTELQKQQSYHREHKFGEAIHGRTLALLRQMHKRGLLTT